MENITKFIETKLRLKVNRTKSKVDRPWRIKYLVFSFYQTIGIIIQEYMAVLIIKHQIKNIKSI